MLANPETLIDKSPFLLCLPIILSSVSSKRLVFNSLWSIFFYSFLNEFTIEFINFTGGNELIKPSASGVKYS